MYLATQTVNQQNYKNKKCTVETKTIIAKQYKQGSILQLLQILFITMLQFKLKGLLGLCKPSYQGCVKPSPF